jgi:hypothetical protein
MTDRNTSTAPSCAKSTVFVITLRKYPIKSRFTISCQRVGRQTGIPGALDKQNSISESVAKGKGLRESSEANGFADWLWGYA